MDNNTQALHDFVKAFTKLAGEHRRRLTEVAIDKAVLENNLQLVREKKYAITDNIWKIEPEPSELIFTDILELIRPLAQSYDHDANTLFSLVQNKPAFITEFVSDVLANRVKKIIDLCRNFELSEDFVTFFSTFVAIPYRSAVAEFIKSKLPLSDHVSGYCPVCGHWPVMSYLAGKEGKKYMGCICCGTIWSFRRLLCPFCLNTDADELGYLNIVEEKVFSAYTCSKCRRYLKSKKRDEEIDGLEHEQIILDYLNSGDVDIAAVQNKFIHEPMLGTRFQGPDDKHIEPYLRKLFPGN